MMLTEWTAVEIWTGTESHYRNLHHILYLLTSLPNNYGIRSAFYGSNRLDGPGYSGMVPRWMEPKYFQ